ncbi:MAG: SelT/SelW/SelH family protein, partial [Caldilineaceae bacterium]|nr:SelT/SelW/SelH family protein [Caldilineaceae bacterium]
AIAEDWCGDVIANLPVVGKLAEQSGKINLRVFLRDQNLDIMDQYLKAGQFRSIPVFVLFDEEFNELGYWIERPAKMTELMAEMRGKLFATDPVLSQVDPNTAIGELPEEARGRLMATFGEFRQQYRTFSDSEVVRELRAIAEHGHLQPHAAPQAPKPAVAVNGTNGVTTTENGRVRVAITYCADCGYEPQTLGLTEALMKAFIHDIGGIELIPWQDGAFDVTVNGDLVHSMYRDGGFPEHGTIIAAVRERMG